MSKITWKVLFVLMDANLFLVIPLALIWDMFLKRHQESAKEAKGSLLTYVKRQAIVFIM